MAARVVPGKRFAFPADHGPHPDFRIEWWYLTANLVDAHGGPLGLQWTLFRQATQAGPQADGWANQQLWMGHAAVTRADTHRFNELYARGGVGQAGVTVKPFAAWIDAWEMKGSERTDDHTLAPLWAVGLTRSRLAAIELTKTLLVALFTALLALPLGLLVAWCLIAIVNVKAFGWRLPFHVFPLHLAELVTVALLASLAAAALPVARLARMQPANLVKVFANER